VKHEADQSAVEPNMWSHTFICASLRDMVHKQRG